MSIGLPVTNQRLHVSAYFSAFMVYNFSIFCVFCIPKVIGTNLNTHQDQ